MAGPTSTYQARKRLSGYPGGRLQTSLNVQYLEKATTLLRAQARVAPPDFTQLTDGVEVVVPISVTDRPGTEVEHANITTAVTPAG